MLILSVIFHSHLAGPQLLTWTTTSVWKKKNTTNWKSEKQDCTRILPSSHLVVVSISYITRGTLFSCLTRARVWGTRKFKLSSAICVSFRELHEKKRLFCKKKLWSERGNVSETRGYNLSPYKPCEARFRAPNTRDMWRSRARIHTFKRFEHSCVKVKRRNERFAVYLCGKKQAHWPGWNCSLLLTLEAWMDRAWNLWGPEGSFFFFHNNLEAWTSTQRKHYVQ